MKQSFNLFTIICLICLLLSPSSGFSEMSKMPDAQLGIITGQAGIPDIMEHFGINQNGETGALYFGDKNNGYLSLADITYDGSMNLEPEPVEVSTVDGVACVVYDMNNTFVDIKHFSANLKLGAVPGTGNSLGRIHFGQFQVNVHGKVRISSL